MSLYSSCNHYRTICSNVKRLTSVKVHLQQWYNIVLAVNTGKFAATSKVATFRFFEERTSSDDIILFLPSVKVNLQQPSYYSSHQYKTTCSILVFLPSVQGNLQSYRMAETLRSFEERSGSDVMILFLPCVKVNLQQCRYILLAITTGQFAAMSKGWHQ